MVRALDRHSTAVRMGRALSSVLATVLVGSGTAHILPLLPICPVCNVSAMRSLRGLAVCALALPAAVGISGCACAGQCEAPYEMDVAFQPGTTHASAQQLLTSCTDHDPVVIRVGPVTVEPGGTSHALIYTQDLGYTPRTAGLLTCLSRSSLRVFVTWPD